MTGRLRIGFDKAVLDASIFVQGFVLEENTEVAIELMGSLDRILAPPLLLYEVGNALVLLARRGLISVEEARTRLDMACRVPNLEIRDHDMTRASELALELGLTFYDAAYVELSIQLGVPLVTADRKLYERARSVAHVIYASDLAGRGTTY